MNRYTTALICLLLTACAGAQTGPVELPVIEEAYATGEAEVFGTWYGVAWAASVKSRCDYEYTEEDPVPALDDAGCALVACVDIAGAVRCEVIEAGPNE